MNVAYNHSKIADIFLSYLHTLFNTKIEKKLHLGRSPPVAVGCYRLHSTATITIWYYLACSLTLLPLQGREG